MTALDTTARERTAPGRTALDPVAADRVPAGPGRGGIEVQRQAVERIAAQAAAEVPGVGGAGGVLGRTGLGDGADRPRARCELYGSVVVLRLQIGLGFPVPLARATRELRRHVIGRVETLTGLEVGRLDVEIAVLRPAAAGRRRELR